MEKGIKFLGTPHLGPHRTLRVWERVDKGSYAAWNEERDTRERERERAWQRILLRRRQVIIEKGLKGGWGGCASEADKANTTDKKREEDAKKKKQWETGKENKGSIRC